MKKTLDRLCDEVLAEFHSEQTDTVITGRYDMEPEYFHEGQSVAWAVRSLALLLLCGKQSGKTTFGISWLLREIQERGPGDYAIVGPSLPILNKKALSEAKRVLCRQERLAVYNTNDKAFTFTAEGLIRMYGTADKLELYQKYAYLDPETDMLEPFDLFDGIVRIHVIPAIDENALEAGSYKAVWGDEMGHPRVKITAHENIEARTAAFRGRICYTTTPYALNWLKSRVYEKAVSAGKPEGASEFVVGQSAKIGCVRFESWMNPRFGMSKFEEIRTGGIPKWRFDLFYRGIFTRPAGQIFDVFDRATHCTPYGPVPKDFPKAWGADFGSRNFAGVKVAIDIARRKAIVYASYHPGVTKSTEEHVASLRRGDDLPRVCKGGAPSEDDWREEFTKKGLSIGKPSITDHETRIQILYSLFHNRKIEIMDGLVKLLEEIESYSRVVDDEGNATEEIENKSDFHRLDALLYIINEIERSLMTLDAA